jgi:hypothetical protein
MISDELIRRLCWQVRASNGTQLTRAIDNLRQAVQEYLKEQDRSNGGHARAA